MFRGEKIPSTLQPSNYFQFQLILVHHPLHVKVELNLSLNLVAVDGELLLKEQVVLCSVVPLSKLQTAGGAFLGDLQGLDCEGGLVPVIDGLLFPLHADNSGISHLPLTAVPRTAEST